jgi:hypothetical protein
MSELLVMFVLELADALLLLPVGSLTCNWSTATETLTGNVWVEGVVQVIDQLMPLTDAAVDADSDVFCTVCGFADDVVQSPGRLSVNAASAFVGL